MLQECLMSGCQRKFSMENCRKESAHKVAKRNATKIPLKPRLTISIIQQSPGNRLHRIEQSGVASSTKEPHNLNQSESVKLKESVKNGKQEPRIHHQTRHIPNQCSICSRQFKAKIGLHSHQRTHNRINLAYLPLIADKYHRNQPGSQCVLFYIRIRNRMIRKNLVFD